MKKKKMMIITAFLLVSLGAGTWLFVNGVSRELWMNSVRTITETTHQGGTALKMQLEADFTELEMISRSIAEENSDTFADTLARYRVVEPDVTVYFPDMESRHSDVKYDETVSRFLKEITQKNGIVDSHISSLTGENVFDIFSGITFADGTDAYLVKEYQAKEIADQFTLSFYNYTGFSYLINKEGNILVRPEHRNSNKTVSNLFDMIPESENHKQMLDVFRESIYELKSGWAKFIYEGEGQVFCYEPLWIDSGWLLVSVVPETVIIEQANSILKKTMIFSGAAAGIILLIVIVFYRGKMRENEEHTKELQEALALADRANEAKGNFLMNMSHDIRTPLNAIIGMTVIAQEHVDDGKRIKDSLKKIKTSGLYLLSLVSDVLDMSQLESGKMMLKEESFCLSQLYEEVTRLMEHQAQEAGVSMELTPLQLRDDMVVGDPIRIRQVLVNIINNAVRYTPAGGRVSLELVQSEAAGKGMGTYIFRCTDTGIGMEKEFMEKMFQPFERYRNTTASKIAGAGVGLTITKSLLDLMGGSISAESEPGKGSVFTVKFYLPIRTEASESQKSEEHVSLVGLEQAVVMAAERTVPSGAEESTVSVTEHNAVPGMENPESPAAERTELQDTGNAEPPVTEPAAEKPMDFSDIRVLLVEDNELNMEIAEEMIGILEAQVEKAYDGQEAVQMFADRPCGYYNMIFMDIQMPVMDGYEATTRIREMDREDAGTVPIFAVSANAFAEDVKNALKSGMNGHIAKPIDLDVIEKVLKEYRM